MDTSWSTIYIHGKAGFKQALEDKLDHTWLQGNSEAGHELVMYWLEKTESLRDFKLAIGSKTIFKYRLCFYPTVDAYLNEKNGNLFSGFTPAENRMVRKMINWQHQKGRQHRLPLESNPKPAAIKPDHLITS